MCLYETKIKNPHYLENEKNSGVPPRIRDWRKEYIKIGCGWCEECRKRISAEWRIRLLEEYKDNQNAEFVTLSFSPESITKLEKEIKIKKYRGIEGDEIDVNILASYAIRMFTERWRKKYKCAPRHFIVTELGHKGTERLHLHGIIWNTTDTYNKTFKKDIEEKWQYGNVYLGEYVNERTMNYITKYITKIDNYHKGFKPRVFVSQKIGAGYLDRIGQRINAYYGEKTYTKYRTEKGYVYELPRYYKYKLYTEEQRDYLWTLNLDKEETWLNKTRWNIYEDDEQKRDNFHRLLETKRENSTRAGYGNLQTINKKYIITDLMKMEHKAAINYDKEKLVKCVTRRTIEKTIYYDGTNNELSKDYKTEKNIYGKYIGTTTEAERKYNALIEIAQLHKTTVRRVRLFEKGIIDKL